MTNNAERFCTPDWVKHAVFYQIFPERFANGDPTNDPENVQPWGSPPTHANYMGGDLQGICDRLDYLQSLGVNALYLNPIFHAGSNHKYNTYDYLQIDPHFGTLATFEQLIAAAHARGMRVVLDGVFNHCGRGFFAFAHVCEWGAASPYARWFQVEGFPLNPFFDELPANYTSWWNFRSLPKFNTDHPPVRRYLLEIARHWIAQGADGWRLDVPNEIADHEFWRTFRRLVKAVNPEAYIVGEIWEDASPWLDGSQFDAVMNYLFRDLCRDYFARESIGVDAFSAGIELLLARYPLEVTQAQLNLLGSHDTARFRSEAGGDLRRIWPAVLFQMTFPGAPCIYYGDEIGLEGGRDPDCRRCFPWDDSLWQHDLLQWTRCCVELRHAHPALRVGAYRTLLDRPPLRVYAFARWTEQELCIVALNSQGRPRTLDLPVRGLPLAARLPLHDLLSHTRYNVGYNRVAQVRLPAYGGVVLHTPL